MPIDIALLAGTIATNFLLPFVKQGAARIGEAIAQSSGAEDGDHARGVVEQVWNTVSGLFSKPADAGLLTHLKDDPEAARPLVESVLRQRLAENPQAAEALDQLVNSPAPSGQTVAASIESAGIAGIVNMPNANLSGAQGLRISGVNIGRLEGSGVPRPPDKKTSR